jgi:hypothetical protein
VANHGSRFEFLCKSKRSPALKLNNSKRFSKLSLLAGALMLLVPRAYSQDAPPAPSQGIPDTAEVVKAIERHDRTQTKALERYHAVRHYKVEYQGFMKHITAAMDVELEYDAATGKSFKVISQKGSHMLCEKVLMRALESEKDAAQDRGAHALSLDNYKFQLLGSEMLDGRKSYVLLVEPISGSPYLYRGKVWVDATDDAVSRMEVQPAKNPSFWISQTLIHQTNSRVDGFWLPQQNQSETKVRIGGKAVMTIEYGPYQIAPSQSPQFVSNTYSELASRNPQAVTR